MLLDDALDFGDGEHLARLSASDDLGLGRFRCRRRGEQIEDAGRESVQTFGQILITTEPFVDAEQVVRSRARIVQTRFDPTTEAAFVAAIAKNVARLGELRSNG